MEMGEAIARLCPQCNLCCNGVLFADVKLTPDDRAGDLKALGLPVRRRGACGSFAQPCAALAADGCCRVYASRPAMCRRFECGVLQEVQTGRLTPEQAIALIRRARRLAENVTRLLRALGNHDEHRPLTRRYQAVMRQPIDLAAGEEPADRRGELMLAVHRLMGIVQARFLRAVETKPVCESGEGA
jgi:hypothetical protein